VLRVGVLADVEVVAQAQRAARQLM